jgi:hypothetical protein
VFEKQASKAPVFVDATPKQILTPTPQQHQVVARKEHVQEEKVYVPEDFYYNEEEAAKHDHENHHHEEGHHEDGQ